MIAEIIVKQARQNGIDGFVFVEFRNILSPEELPDDYKYGKGGETTCFWSHTGKGLHVYPQYGHNIKYCINDFISKEDFHKLISILKQAGQRLTDINKELKKNWVDDKKIMIKI